MYQSSLVFYRGKRYTNSSVLQDGVNRSVSIIFSYLMKHKEHTLQNASEIFRKKRPNQYAQLNRGFMKQLHKISLI